MTRPARERIYGLREIVRILTLTAKRSAQLRRLGLLHGEAGYTFRDLLALRAAGTLLDAGASVRQINAALTALRRHDPALEQPLATVRFLVDGPRLLAQSDRVRFDPRTVQTVLDLEAGGSVVRTRYGMGRLPCRVGGSHRSLPAGGGHRSVVLGGLEQPGTAAP